MNDEYRPRFSFEVTDEQKERADRLIGAYGTRKAMFGQILDDTLDLIDEYGGVIIGIVASGKIKPREVIPSLKKAEEVGKHGKY